ncbi:MAG: septal ring lytic transglycosylase RlpA family protein [Candidatus Eisenbacteria bacterium]|nr:septal ring lytic transglycosylase RlpA family protein [Candidatus Eisenbacteria bacterium]
MRIALGIAALGLALACVTGCATGGAARGDAAAADLDAPRARPAAPGAAPQAVIAEADDAGDGDTEVGLATYYAQRFAGRRTASGAAYDPDALTGAHRTLAFGTRVRVTNLANRRSVVVVITDRGPFDRRRIIDLSRRAARTIGMLRDGVARVRVEPITG